MRKIIALALSCLMVAGIFAGCRKNSATETMVPSGSTNATTAQTSETTRNTTPATQATRDTQATQQPSGGNGSGMTNPSTSNPGTDAGRAGNMPPRY